MPNLNTVDVANAIRNSASKEYQDRIPVANQDNLKEISKLITDYTPTFDEFTGVLLNRIAKVLINTRHYENPLAMLKRGKLEFGQVIEDVFVNIIKATEFNYNDQSDDNPFKRYTNDIKVALYQLNEERQYGTTVSPDMVRTAFLSADGMNNLITIIVSKLYDSNQFDEFLITKKLISEGVAQGYFKEITVPTLSAQTGNETVKTMKNVIDLMTFLGTDYNKQGVHTFTPIEDQIIICTPNFKNTLDVDVLAKAFNIDRVTFMSKMVVIDNFIEMDGVECVLLDKEMFQIWDNLIETTSIYNPKKLYTNYWLTLRQTFALSPFGNAVVFKSTEPATNCVTEPTT